MNKIVQVGLDDLVATVTELVSMQAKAAPIPHDGQSTTIEEFCEANRISRATWYRMLRAGKAPKTIKLGRSVRIPITAIAEWQKQNLS
jgi:excisionase family DNA binding protein